MENRYYWLKLQQDFFSSKRIKKMRKLPGGDTLTIIYLKMQLLALKTDGVLSYTGLEQTFAEELALDLDEDAESVQLALAYMSSTGLIETSDNISFLLPYVVENTGSEGSSAKRMRDLRERQKASLCDNGVTEQLQIGYGEKEIEKEIEKDIYTPSFQTPIEELFLKFWKAYPKKVGKQDALKAFKKIKPSKELVSKMVSVIEEAKNTEQWTKNNGQYIPNPSTWLNQGRWEDDINTYSRKSTSEGRRISEDRYAGIDY